MAGSEERGTSSGETVLRAWGSQTSKQQREGSWNVGIHGMLGTMEYWDPWNVGIQGTQVAQSSSLVATRAAPGLCGVLQNRRGRQESSTGPSCCGGTGMGGGELGFCINFREVQLFSTSGTLFMCRGWRLLMRNTLIEVSQLLSTGDPYQSQTLSMCSSSSAGVSLT